MTSDALTQGSTIRVLLVATSLARTSGGGAVFLEGLIGGLLTRSEVELLVAARPESLPPHLLRHPKLQVIGAEGPVGRGRFITDTVVALRARSLDVDVIHYPHDWCPPSSLPVVLTIQNIGPFHPSSSPDFGARGLALRLLAKQTAHRAAAIVSVSKVGRAIWEGAVPSAPVTDVIPEGFTPSSHTTAPAPRGQYADGYVLAVTGEAPYKCAPLTIEAMLAHTAIDPTVRWLVAGTAIGAWHDGDRRVGLGQVERSRLLELMAGARCVVFLSEVESFGLPAVEAVSTGTLPVVLEGTAMAEWMREQCVVTDPSVNDVVDAVRQVMARDHTPVQLPNEFEWADIAARYEEVYRRVVG